MSDKTKPPPDPEPSIYDRRLVKAPGPGKYSLDKYSDFAPSSRGANRWSFGSKFRVKREDVTPGPDQYANPRSSFGGTKWTMGARFKNIHTKEDEPGKLPDGKAVVPPSVKSLIGTGPKFTMAGRTRAVRTDVTPDPTKYQPLQALKFTTTRVPSYSMGAKFRTLDRDPYYVPADKSSGKAEVPQQVKPLIGTGGPKYSFGGRTHRPRQESTPGPGHVMGPLQLDLVGKSGPRFSMSARVRKGIGYGYWGDEPKLAETTRLPSMEVVRSH